MQKREDVVIHIPKDIYSKLTFLIGDAEYISNTPVVVYDELRVEFLSDLSKKLLGQQNIRDYPDVATFAFWCRKSNLLRIMNDQDVDHLRLGLGLAFHISPSNVPVNFAFSLAFGILSGNICVVRLPSNDHESSNVIVKALSDLLHSSKYIDVDKFIHLIKFERDDHVNQFWMSVADARIVWGGDATVSLMRKYDCKPRSREVVFPDRFSLCAINAEYVLQVTQNELDVICKNLFNDIYIMDQNACSSPQLFAWVGDDKSIIDKAKKKLWTDFSCHVQEVHDLEPIHYMDKYVDACMNAIHNDNVVSIKHENNLLFNIELSHFHDKQQDQRGYFGTIQEVSINTLDELSEIIDDRCQTLTYLGFSKDYLHRFVVDNQLRGIDRIVPMGKSLDMGTIWDGYDIIGHLSRIVHIY